MLHFTFHAGTSWVAKIIKLVTRSTVSHVEECVNLDTMEANGIDVGYSLGSLPISRASAGTRLCVVDVEATDEQIAKFKAAKKEIEGAKYDYLGILGFALNKQKLNKDSRWYCSEVEAYALEKAGLPPFRKGSVHWTMVSPKMLFLSPIFKNARWGTVQEDGTVKWD